MRVMRVRKTYNILYISGIFFYFLFSIKMLSAGIITVEKTNVPEAWVSPGETNIPVMALKINDSASHKITNIKIKNLGDMNNVTDVSNLKLWYDMNKNGIWDPGDQYITNAVWNAGNNSWDFAGLGAIGGSSGAIDLSGWRLYDEFFSSYIIPNGTILPPDRYLIISLNSDQANFEFYYGVSMPPGSLFLDSANILLDWDGFMDSFEIVDDNFITRDGPTCVFNTAPSEILDFFDFPDQYNMFHINFWGMPTGDCDFSTTSEVDPFCGVPPCFLRIDWTGVMPAMPGCWQSSLDDMGFGVDISGATNLVILVVGDVGGEEVDICLEDAMFGFACIPWGLFFPGPDVIDIPLADFSDLGVDLTQIVNLYIMPTAPMDGTIYVEAIIFPGADSYRKERIDPEADSWDCFSWTNGVSIWGGVEPQDTIYSNIVISEVHFEIDWMMMDPFYSYIEIYNDSAPTPGGIASGTNLIVTMDVSSGAASDRYFKAYIEANNIICSAGSTGPSSVVSNGTRQTVIGTTTLSLTKSISNITIGGINCAPIPGATILYRISYSNTGSVNAINMVIYDEFPINTTYLTNYMGTASGWTSQFSVISSPDQSYNSADYSNWYTMMSNFQWRDNLKWIRWKKSTVLTLEDGLTLFYKIIIK